MVRVTSVLVTGVYARVLRDLLDGYIETWTAESGAVEERVDTATLPRDLYDQVEEAVLAVLGDDLPDYIVLCD